MTGPEHYREAERFLTSAAEHGYNEDEMDLATWDMSRAQVHATLALAAATGAPHADTRAWAEVAR